MDTFNVLIIVVHILYGNSQNLANFVPGSIHCRHSITNNSFTQQDWAKQRMRSPSLGFCWTWRAPLWVSSTQSCFSNEARRTQIYSVLWRRSTQSSPCPQQRPSRYVPHLLFPCIKTYCNCKLATWLQRILSLTTTTLTFSRPSQTNLTASLGGGPPPLEMPDGACLRTY